MTDPLKRAAFNLEIVAGPDTGKQVVLPAAGARLGRSSQNAIALSDPLLSRQHCEFSFRPDQELWVKDLESANQTLVNDRAVESSRIRIGDRVTVGDTTLRVVDDRPLNPPADARAAPASNQTAAPPPIVDLGFDAAAGVEREGRLSRRFWWMLGGAIVVLLTLALGLRLIGSRAPSDRASPRPVIEADTVDHFELRYEKVDAHTNNIFRYKLQLRADGVLAVRIDDLAQSRHVRKEQPVEAELVKTLLEAIRRSGFFSLEPRYEGLSTPDQQVSWDIEIILDRRVYRTVVENRTEPPAFRAVRERIETFSQSELGIWALQYPRERLIEMAYDTLLLGRKLHEERDVAHGNLAEAVARFREADFYLETIDPKPDFYPRIVEGLREATDRLDERYREYRFRADRAMNLGNWDTAARELRTLMELIPDRRDERHQEAHRKLLDVETRLRLRRRS